jgi:uncharacterized protein YkwD
MKKTLKITSIFFLLSLFFVGVSSVSAYSDLSEDHPYYKAIQSLSDSKIISGYTDGTFQPENPISRAEFTKLVVLADDPEFNGKPKDCFPDVNTEQWFSSYVCYAEKENIISGYPDGTFQPTNPINLTEATKILYETINGKKLTPGKEWYSAYIDYFTENKYIPKSVVAIDQKLTRAEVAELIWRMTNKIDTLKSATITQLDPIECLSSPDKVDMNQVRSTWLTWLNDVRTDLGLNTFTYSQELNYTATKWSEIAKSRGYIDHKRVGQSSYYDYSMITDWFKSFGLEFKNVNSVTFTETIGYGYYSCKSDDCTQALIDGIKSTYNFIMNEKGKAYRPHYNSLVNAPFNQIGLGITTDGNKYYLTLHYGTSLESAPENICAFTN